MSIQKLIDTYAHWLKEEIVFKKMGEFYEITTPFYNNANDCIQIYIYGWRERQYCLQTMAIL